MLRLVPLLLLFNLGLMATEHNLNALGRGGVGVSWREEDSTSWVLINPAHLALMNGRHLDLENRMMMDSRTIDFMWELPSNNAQNIVDLMNKNIAHPLTFLDESFFSFSDHIYSHQWLLGVSHRLESRFVTHTGFGSMGAMESSVDRYTTLVASLATSRTVWQYGMTLRKIWRSQTLHNYTIAEIIDTEHLWNYFNTPYTQTREALAVDVGLIHHGIFGDSAISFQNIGNTEFGKLGTIQSTCNVGFSRTDREIDWGVDMVDIFHASFKDTLRLGIGHSFDRLHLQAGLLEAKPTWGMGYQYGHLKVTISGYNGYGQLQLAWHW